MSSDVFQVNQGLLYLAFQRMRRKSCIRSWRSAGAVFRVLDWAGGVA